MTKKAPYSTSFSNSKGRLHIEAESINRIHSREIGIELFIPIHSGY